MAVLPMMMMMMQDECSHTGQKIVISETICVGLAIPLQIYQDRKEVMLIHLQTQNTGTKYIHICSWRYSMYVYMQCGASLAVPHILTECQHYGKDHNTFYIHSTLS
jgi:hypothetical protein